MNNCDVECDVYFLCQGPLLVWQIAVLVQEIGGSFINYAEAILIIRDTFLAFF